MRHTGYTGGVSRADSNRCPWRWSCIEQFDQRGDTSRMRCGLHFSISTSFIRYILRRVILLFISLHFIRGRQLLLPTSSILDASRLLALFTWFAASCSPGLLRYFSNDRGMFPGGILTALLWRCHALKQYRFYDDCCPIILFAFILLKTPQIMKKHENRSSFIDTMHKSIKRLKTLIFGKIYKI